MKRLIELLESLTGGAECPDCEQVIKALRNLDANETFALNIKRVAPGQWHVERGRK